MDHLLERIEALEHQTHRVEQQLRWWRGLACVLIVVALVTWSLPSSTAQEDARRGEKGLVQRVADLEKLLKHFSREGNEIFIKGANLHIVNGLGQTDCGPEDNPIANCPNGLGNLIVGYNESRKEDPGCEPDSTDPLCTDIRIGSHNAVVGQSHNFSHVGGLVVGFSNTTSGNFASASGGRFNTVSGDYASVSGGQQNTASGETASVSGGIFNTASGVMSSVSGGDTNTAGGARSSISGGGSGIASGDAASVSGGFGNTASAGVSSVSGGQQNTASGGAASVSGGSNRTAEGESDWVAGSLFEDN